MTENLSADIIEESVTLSEPTTRIHNNAIKAWMLTASVYGLAWFIPSFFVAALQIGEGLEYDLSWIDAINWPVFFSITILELTIYLLGIFLIPRVRWKRWKYNVSGKEIDMERGIFISKRTLIPINRVQHVDTRKGPIYRSFGLSSVAISTAATTHEIPALDDETADALRNTISTLVRKVKEDV